MRWSFPVGRLFGVQVRVHTTFPLLLLYIAGLEAQAGGDFQSVIRGLAGVLLAFGCVLLHEFGHVLAARQFGCRTRDVTLLPIGGVASMERIPEKPLQELWVAVAGPLVNVVIAGGLMVLFGIGIKEALNPNATLGTASLPKLLLTTNILMVLFNLLPAFPMDGGRVLRALLAMRMDYVRATQMAAKVGRVMAVFIVLGGVLIPLPLMALVGVFVWIGAGSEASNVALRALLKNVRVRAAMVTDFKILSPFDTLSDVSNLVLAGSQKEFPVANQGAVLGVLTYGRLLVGLEQKGSDALVSDVMDPEFAAVAPDDLLETVLTNRAQAGGGNSAIPVMEGERLAGLLTPEHIGELLAIRQALAARTPR